MHTSTELQADHFQYALLQSGTETALTFDGMFPDYHRQDRVAVVGATMEGTVRAARGTLLALTTGFYDALRARGGAFFDYPQHFCILAGDERGIRTQSGFMPMDLATIGKPWTMLDVWPESKWHTAPPTAAGLMRSVFAMQIDRLFWPESLKSRLPTGEGARLPDYIRKTLGTHLKQVWYYDTTWPTHRVTWGNAAQAMIDQSEGPLLKLLNEPPPARQRDDRTERFRLVPVDSFLSEHAAVFA